MIRTGFLPHDCIENSFVISKVSPDAVVRHTQCVLPMAGTAWGNGYKRKFVRAADADEAVLIPHPEILLVKMLPDLYRHLSGRYWIEPLLVQTDFSETKELKHVECTLEVSAAGGHNVFMAGSRVPVKLCRCVP